MANLSRASGIKGWMSGSELEFLAKLANRSKNILEIGAYCGRSTRALADNTEGKILSIDPWDGDSQDHKGSIHFNGNSAEFNSYKSNLCDHIQSGKVSYIKGLFHELDFGNKYDFIFIDALHDYESVKRDIIHASKFLTQYGVLAGHDYCHYWNGVQQIVNEMFPHFKTLETIWYVE